MRERREEERNLEREIKTEDRGIKADKAAPDGRFTVEREGGEEESERVELYPLRGPDCVILLQLLSVTD